MLTTKFEQSEWGNVRDSVALPAIRVGERVLHYRRQDRVGWAEACGEEVPEGVGDFGGKG